MTSDMCRNLSRSISGVMSKSRYCAVKEYKETVDSLRRSTMGFASYDYLKHIEIWMLLKAKRQ